jgi:hypothetical protein
VDAGYISAFSALAGAAIGGLASFSTSWVTQRSQLRHSFRQAEQAKLEAMYNEFISEAARLLGDALTHQKDDIADMVGLYASVGRMRLMSPRPVVTAAEQVIENIIETYLAPNRGLHEMIDYVKQGRMDILLEFTEACRQDLAQRYTNRR